MLQKIALSLFFAAFCWSAIADERFPNADIQWILDQYQVSEAVSLIPAEGLAGWTHNNARKIPEKSKWSNRDGKIVLDFSDRSIPGGEIVTEKQYTNFILDFVWVAQVKNCNNGIKYRVRNYSGKGWLGIEYQIMDEVNKFDRGSTASLYYLFAPNREKKKLNPFGQANTGRIIVLDNHIEHWLNGQKVTQCEVGSDAWQKAVADSKFSEEELEHKGFGENQTGFIMLTDHGGAITYEKLVIREIGSKK
jgi:hypothetical protein